MKIFLTSTGDLRDYFGRDPQEIVLTENATLRDLLLEIGNRWGRKLPPYLWDQSKNIFRGSVFFLIGKEVVQDTNLPLSDGLQITLMKALVGG